MRDLRELNMNDGGLPVDRKPPSDNEIREFEMYFGVELPGDYVKFLRHSNGGHPELDAYVPLESTDSELEGVSHFYYLDDDQQGLEGLWGETKVWRDVLSPDIVPIADDGLGNQILLSFDQDPPSVKLCIHDEGMR